MTKMKDSQDAVPIGWLTSAVIGAGESIDILANLDPRTRLGSMLANTLGTMTALADQRLRLRCVIHFPTDPSGRAQVRADAFGDEITTIGWEVRTIQTPPTMDLIIVDGEIAHAVFNDRRAVVISSGENEQTIRTLRRHFEELWKAAANVGGENQLLFEDLISPEIPVFAEDIVRVSKEMWDQLIVHLAQYPEDLYRLEPRKFEELVAELLVREGMQVQLTPETRDRGRDILALQHGPAGHHLYLVECKRYAPNRPIGVELVRSLYGVLEQERATAGVLITTSRFTRDALKFADPIRYRLSLKEFDDLKKWLLMQAKCRT